MATDPPKTDRLSTGQHPKSLEDIMARCCARLAPTEFVKIVSNTWHELEAPFYDSLHPEIFDQVPPVLDSFLSHIQPLSRPQRALDIGCGTGFASQLLLEKAGSQIEQLVCADVSPHMLEHCRQKLGQRTNVRFLQGDISLVGSEFSSFDLVVTCALIHHILDVSGFLEHLCRLIRPGGYYFMLHEPSRRFYRNPECIALLKQCENVRPKRPLLRFFNPMAYYRRLLRIAKYRGISTTIHERTSQLLIERKAMRFPLTMNEISQVVDIHAPPLDWGSIVNWRGGFEIDELRSSHLSSLSLLSYRSYGFLGPIYEKLTPRSLQRQGQLLASRYPGDGSSFCTLWHKPGGSEPLLHSSEQAARR
jgi:ubiquinone/menaquinone biosynthesis C-methylase UbiE